MLTPLINTPLSGRRDRRRAGFTGVLPIVIVAGALLLTALLTTDSFSKTIIKQQAPSSPPREYAPIIPCHARLGQVWAPPSAFQPAGGNEPPMLGFSQGQLVGMVFYLSEKHLFPLLGGGKARWAFGGNVNATIDSVSVAPAQLRPHPDKRAYELIVMVHHEPPIEVKCAASNAPTTSQGQGGGSMPNQGGGGSGGGTKKPKK
jgi:hypothetical protein